MLNSFLHTVPELKGTQESIKVFILLTVTLEFLCQKKQKEKNKKKKEFLVQGNRSPQDGGSRPPGPSPNPSSVNILSINCQGLNDNDKIDQILTHISSLKLNLLLYKKQSSP